MLPNGTVVNVSRGQEPSASVMNRDPFAGDTIAGGCLLAVYSVCTLYVRCVYSVCAPHSPRCGACPMLRAASSVQRGVVCSPWPVFRLIRFMVLMYRIPPASNYNVYIFCLPIVGGLRVGNSRASVILAHAARSVACILCNAHTSYVTICKHYSCLSCPGC